MAWEKTGPGAGNRTALARVRFSSPSLISSIAAWQEPLLEIFPAAVDLDIPFIDAPASLLHSPLLHSPLTQLLRQLLRRTTCTRSLPGPIDLAPLH